MVSKFDGRKSEESEAGKFEVVGHSAAFFLKSKSPESFCKIFVKCEIFDTADCQAQVFFCCT